MTHTTLASEIIAWDDDYDVRGIWMAPLMGGVAFTTHITPNPTTLTASNVAKGYMDYVLYCNSEIPENYCVKTSPTATNSRAAARSKHPGGVNTVLADGSVEFIDDSIEPLIWSSRGSIRGNQTIEKHDLIR